MDAAPIGITIADMQADNEPLVYINECFERMTGYTIEETLGENCRFMQGEKTEAEPVQRMRQAIEAREPVQVELRNYRKDGTMFWNQIRLAPIPYNGEVPYYVGFQQDITLRKEYQRHLETQRDDLAVLNQMVRHDIRNDLQVVLSSLELLAPHVPAEQQDRLAVAFERIERAISLTRSAADLAEAMLSTGLSLEPVSLTDALAPELDTARSAEPDATVTLDGDLPAVDVVADDMLDAVFRNLLQNALAHSDRDHPSVTVSATVEDEVVRVAVADDGPGVPDDRKEEILTEGVTGEDSGSTGIGLHLVTRLLDSYNGALSIEDNEPRGAIFTVEVELAG